MTRTQIGIVQTGNVMFDDPSFGGRVSFVINPPGIDGAGTLPKYKLLRTEPSDDFSAVIEQWAETMPRNKFFFVRFDGDTENGKFFDGIDEVLEKYNIVLGVCGTAQEFTAQRPAKLLLKHLLENKPDRVDVCPIVSDLAQWEAVLSKPVVKQAFAKSMDKMVIIYVADVEAAKLFKEVAETIVLWKPVDSDIDFNELIDSYLASYSADELKNRCGTYQSNAKMRVYAIENGEISLTGAEIPGQHRFSVHEVVHIYGKFFGKIRSEQNKWVVLSENNFFFATQLI